MESFGDELNVINKDKLKILWRLRLLEKFRKHLYNFMLERTRENDFFDIDSFNRNYVRDMNVTTDILNQVILELEKLGWNTYVGFGGTGLYVYSSDDIPGGVY